jgi:nicotinate-nucleotide adenylyltransferase
MTYHEPMSGADKTGRIAIFGGSFDPPHLGHIGIARAALNALQLDGVLFTPVGVQPLKPHGATASYEDRVAMTELAIKGKPEFTLSRADAPREDGRPNYTIDTLLKLRNEFPAAELFTLVGADSFRSLSEWHEGAKIPFVAPLIVASRPGEDLNHLQAVLPEGLSIKESEETEHFLQTFTVRNASGNEAKLYLLPGTAIDISATDVRRQVHAGPDRLSEGTGLIPDAVCKYIAAHGLYR